MKTLFHRFLEQWKRRKRLSASCSEVLEAEQEFYKAFVKPGMVVFDIGANVGNITSLFAKQTTENGQVHAFEPGSDTYEKLVHRIAGEKVPQVVVNRLALSDTIGKAKFHVYDKDHSTLNSLADRPLENYGIDLEKQVEEVCTMTVDAYCRDHDVKSIDLLKIDVEGAELAVLRGASEMFAKKQVRCCIFEFGQTLFDMGEKPEAIIEFMNTHGYVIRNLIKGDPLFPGGEKVSSAQFSMHIAEPSL